MSVYNKSGTELEALYGISGDSLESAYDIAENEVFSAGGSSGDYDEWSTDYQHTILQARDQWAEAYREDATIIPFVVSTDQHRYLKYSKSIYDYLVLALKWSEVSCSMNLGDTCGAIYNTTDLNYMLSCFGNIPKNKQINVAGNHDQQTSKDEGSSYAYKAIDNDTFTVLQNTYFNNSQYDDGTTNVRYGNRGNEYVIDKAHGIKWCIFTTWYYNDNGQVYYDPQLSGEAADAWISMLSANDGYDIIVLSHITPYYHTQWNIPAVDGNEASVKEGARGTIHKINPRDQINVMLADRKAKRSGSIVDYDGNIHTYDFSGCTSDILCIFAGHSHADGYQYSADGNVPCVVFDAMGYDAHPIYLVNVDRTNEKVDVWKIGDDSTIYTYSVPFTEQTA